MAPSEIAKSYDQLADHWNSDAFPRAKALCNMSVWVNLTALALVLGVPLSGHAQTARSNQAEAFAKVFVDAINSKSSGRRLALLHPKSKACINAQTQPYYDWIFSRQAAHVIPAVKYKATAEPLAEKQLLPADGKSDYPVRPSHRLQIDFDTGPYSATSIVLLLIHDGTRWYEVWPCPRPDTIVGIHAIEAPRAEQKRKVGSLVAALADPLRGEIIALARQGRRIDAITKYREATGHDLTTAKDVVDLLVPR